MSYVRTISKIPTIAWNPEKLSAVGHKEEINQ